MITLLLFVGLALGVSFLCSILESVLLSITPAWVSLQEQQQRSIAGELRALKEDIDRPLAAILSLNTIANTVGATGAGAQAVRLFGSAWLGLFTAVFTFLILVGAEIVPKTLGAVHWKRLAPLVVRVLRVLVPLMLPLVKLAEWLTDLLTPGGREPVVSRDELAALAEEGEREGVVAEGETRVLKNLLRLSVLRAADIMTPAGQMVTLPADMPVGDALQRMSEVGYSRVPLDEGHDGSVECVNYVLRDDVFELAARDEHRTLVCDVARNLLRVPADMRVPGVFDRMVERREHIAIVEAPQDGRIDGLVTMEDIIETLLGLDILDESDEATVHALARQEWEKRARRRVRGG